MARSYNFSQVHMQNPQTLNVLPVIFVDSLVGSFFLPENLTDLPQNTIDPALTITIENNPTNWQLDRTKWCNRVASLLI